MLEFWHRHCRPCVAAALVPASLLGGCGTQLAVSDPYYASFAAVKRAYSESARRTLTDGRSMQTLQAACARAGRGADGSGDADLDTPGGREAFDKLCAEWRGRAPGAYGGILNAHQRWAQDKRRQLPNPTTTAASPGGS